MAPMCMRVWVYLCVCICVCVCVSICVCVYICICVYTRVSVSTWVCVRMCVTVSSMYLCGCMCLYMCVHVVCVMYLCFCGEGGGRESPLLLCYSLDSPWTNRQVVESPDITLEKKHHKVALASWQNFFFFMLLFFFSNGIRSHHFMGNRWRNSGNGGRFYFGELQNHCRWWLQPWS